VINWVGGPARYLVDPGIPSADYNSLQSSTSIPTSEPSNPQRSLSGSYSPPGYLCGVFAYTRVDFTNNGSSQFTITLHLKVYLDGTQMLYSNVGDILPPGETWRLHIVAFCVAGPSQIVSAKAWISRQSTSVSYSGAVVVLRGYGAVSLAQLCRHLNSRRVLTAVGYTNPSDTHLAAYRYWDGTIMRQPATNTLGGIIFTITPSTPTYIFRYGTPAPPVWVVTAGLGGTGDIAYTRYYVLGVA
jgi:hypothetical protein